LGWWSVMTQAAFSFIGTEIVAVRMFTASRYHRLHRFLVQIAAGEAKNPRRNLPKAIRRVYIRILLFYIGGVSIIGLLVPSNDPHLGLNKGTAAASPFVIAIERSGIKVLPHVGTFDHLSLVVPDMISHSLNQIINACLVTSAWSAASSDMYTSSRALCSY
jgi:amino acid transporter